VLARPAKPPPYGCFTVPRFQLLPALESLLGLLFANLFWVGLWDLLDNTIFPSENSVQMLSLVRALLAAASAKRSRQRILMHWRDAAAARRWWAARCCCTSPTRCTSRRSASSTSR
jgi:hypothetical protein